MVGRPPWIEVALVPMRHPKRYAPLPPKRPITLMATPCREWWGPNVRGYGVRGRGPGTRLIHRWVAEQVHGPLGPDVDVMHLCDNPPCYRYDHLRIVPTAENMRDMVTKGRSAARVRHPRAKLTEKQVASVLPLLAAGATMSALAREFGVNRTTILRIRDGKGWK